MITSMLVTVTHFQGHMRNGEREKKKSAIFERKFTSYLFFSPTIYEHHKLLWAIPEQNREEYLQIQQKKKKKSCLYLELKIFTRPGPWMAVCWQLGAGRCTVYLTHSVTAFMPYLFYFPLVLALFSLAASIPFRLAGYSVAGKERWHKGFKILRIFFFWIVWLYSFSFEVKSFSLGTVTFISVLWT